MSSEGDSDSDVSWRGVPLTEMYGAQTPWGSPEFPLVRPSHDHTVLYHIPSDGCIPEGVPPKPQVGQDIWDHDHVRMPCSSHSLYPVEDESGELQLKKRWQLIKHALWNPIRNSKELADAILSYNTKYKNIWKFNMLHKLFNNYLEEEESRYFFDVTLPEMAKLALSLPKLIQAPIPLLRQNQNKSISLSQQQISCLLANAFFCTFPRRNNHKKREAEYGSYPSINFYRLFNAQNGNDQVLEKLKCLCHYFRVVCTTVPTGVVTFSRRSVDPATFPDWQHCEQSIATLPLHVDHKLLIEDAHGLIQVDFANKFLGGGVIGCGCVQEEIRFVICPELMASMVFTEFMKPNEAVMIIGIEQYCEYRGYGDSFEFSGAVRDRSPRDSSARRRRAVLAIDALSYSRWRSQYSEDSVRRELNKAWTGFSFFTECGAGGLRFPGVATGNWGCGAFRGSPELKALVQLAAAARAARALAYCTFGDTHLRDQILNIYNLLSRYNVTVGQLYKYILRYCETDTTKTQLYPFIHQAILDDVQGKSSQNISEAVKMSIPISDSSVMNTLMKSDKLPLGGQNHSPDLFSQEDSEHNTDDQSSEELKQVYQKVNNANSNATVTTSDNKMAATENKMASQTSRLFEEMNKFDETNGLLHFSSSSTVPSQNECVNSEEKVDTKLIMSPESKKKMTRKITDYFSKKST